MSRRVQRRVYVVLTKDKVHVFGSYSRQQKVLARGERMFPDARWEATSADVRNGDPYKRPLKSTACPGWVCACGEAA